jgi:oligosaccharide repeat unit polymerase
MLDNIGIYFITLCIYISWLIYAIKSKKAFKFPIIFSCFLGMFIFNALGSILIMFPEELELRDKNYFSYSYILILNIQAIIFYWLAGVYFYFSKPLKKINKIIQSKKIDNWFLYFLLMLIGLFLVFFFYKAGNPPLLEILKGNLISSKEIVAYRTQSISSVSSTLSNLGFTILPIFVSAYVFLKSSLKNKRSYYDYFIIGICLLTSALRGGKGNILYVCIALFFAYIINQREYASTSNNRILTKSVLLWFSTAFIPVLFLYNVYYGAEFSIFEKLKLLIFRIIGVYSESLAATVIYTEQHGFLNGTTFPTIRGLLSHESINMPREMSRFIYSSNAVGNTPISAVAEGYINFGWYGFILFSFVTFITVILFQEFFRHTPRNLFTLSLMVVCCVLAIQISQTSLFATFISFTYALFFLFLFLVRCILTSIHLRQNLVKSLKMIDENTHY